MFKFEKEQKIFNISGVNVGGQLGQFPTVMIGSIFYHKDKLVEEDKTGKFQLELAEETIKNEESISKKTGNPRIVDVCCAWPDAFPKYIDFIAKVIEGPFSIDGSTTEVRVAGAKYVGESGLSERVVYNSISPETKEIEMSAIQEAKIKSAILLSLNNRKPTINGRLEVIDGLLEKATRAGIKNVLIDTTVLDKPDPGPASKAIYLVKERYGLPAGCGAHNAVDMWEKSRRLSKEIYMMNISVVNALPIVMGANFVLYGPVALAPKIYFPCAFMDACIAYSAMQEYKTRPLTQNHPLFKVFSI